MVHLATTVSARLRNWLGRDPYLLLLLGLSLFSLTPLTAPGYFYEAHDGRHSVFYLIMFDASFRDGAWWPRWAMHHIQGYGYPTFILQAPLGFFLAEIFVLLGAGYTLAAKLAWATGVLAGAWGMYALVRSWANRINSSVDPRWAGVVAGLLYVYIPYHLVDIYVRAALNDSLLLGWFPWVLLTFDRLIEAGNARGWRRRLGLAILTLGGTLLTHTFALISFAPLLISFVIFKLLDTWQRERAFTPLLRRTILAGAGGLAALLLFATFLLPLLGEGQRYLQQQVYVTDTYDFRRHFVQLGQYFSPFWGFGYSDDPNGANDGMSFQIGLIPLLLSIAVIYSLWRRPAQRGLLLYLLGMTVALLVVMSPLAAPLWEAVPALAVIQFPWRLLALSALTISALGGLAVYQLAGEEGKATGGLVLVGCLVLFGSAPYLQAQLQPVEPWREDGRAIFRFEQEHPDMLAFTAWVSETFAESPMTADYAAESYREDYSANGVLTRLAILQGSGEILSQYSRGSSFGGVVRMETPGVVRIHVLYFPGWQVRIDDVLTQHRVSEPNGLIEVDVPAGEHRIDMEMGSTPIRQAGTAISWATFLGVLGLLLWREGERATASQ